MPITIRSPGSIPTGHQVGMQRSSHSRARGSGTRAARRSGSALLTGRSVASGSVFSTILIATVVGDLAPSGRFDRLIDIGSGDSPYRSVIDHREYVGIDRSPKGTGLQLVMGDATSIPVRDASAGALLCTEVIEHVPDERLLAAELHRIATPGAPLLLSAPFVHGLHEQPYDFRRLTSIGLVATLERAGWQVEEVASIGGPVVVSIDGLVRWADSWWRRIVRAIVPTKFSRDVLDRPSATLQRLLAGVALSRSRYLQSIDPMAPSPRLTLGYVVRARRTHVSS